MIAHIFYGRYGVRREPNKHYCAAAVHDTGSRSVGFHQCNNAPKVEREVEGKKYGFCKIHDPVVVDARRKKIAKRHETEAQARQDCWDRHDAIFKAKNEAIRALKKIADGHNDPRSLAKETLEMLPKDYREDEE